MTRPSPRSGLSTGSERWRLFVGGDVKSGTTLADGRLIIGTDRGDVIAIGAKAS